MRKEPLYKLGAHQSLYTCSADTLHFRQCSDDAYFLVTCCCIHDYFEASIQALVPSLLSVCTSEKEYNLLPSLTMSTNYHRGLLASITVT